MTIFQSTVSINKPAEEVYQFLADMNNHGKLMPSDISGWSSTLNEASFTVRNMIKLTLKIDERISNSEIKIIAVEDPPFSIELKWMLTPNENYTKVLFTIVADLNMMMKMLASAPLQKLADEETINLAKLLTNS